MENYFSEYIRYDDVAEGNDYGQNIVDLYAAHTEESV